MTLSLFRPLSATKSTGYGAWHHNCYKGYNSRRMFQCGFEHKDYMINNNVKQEQLD